MGVSWGAPGPANELELEVQLQRVTLRDFDYRLEPLRGPVEVRSAVFAEGVKGLELEVTARDTGLRVSLRWERFEFVNLATAGLAMLDAGDAADEQKGRG